MEKLVSVPVLTYNAAEFVVETLESIFNQTYKKIELIVSDDCSKDQTVAIVNEWCSEARVKERFSNIKIITVPKNTGIPANFNRCAKACSGEWMKMISGDDALMPNCVADNIDFVTKNPDVKALYSYNKVYRNDFKEENFIRLNPGVPPTNIISPELTASDQYKLLIQGDKIPFTPSLFLNTKALLSTGLPDEDLFSEDYQNKLALTRSGYKLHFMEKETVLYRQHDNATNNTVKEYILKPHYFKTEEFRKRYIYPNIPLDIKRNHQFSWIANQVFRIPALNRKNRVNNFISYLLTNVFNPFKYVIYFKSHYMKRYKDDLFYNYSANNSK